MPDTKLKIAAIGDIHVKENSTGAYQQLFTQVSQEADLLLLCGDLTNLGLPEEGTILVSELKACTIPVVAVLGNHDHESDKSNDIFHMLQDSGVHVLQGTEFIFEKEQKKYGFTGVKGFGGGFRPSMWGRFGEKEQKAFYDAVATEVSQLEVGLNTLKRIPDLEKIFVLMHFSPIRDTLVGEEEELYAFLGSTRLEEVIDRYEIAAVFHGHAHFGTHQGKTGKEIPVYNVAMPVMQKINSEKPYALIEF